MKSTPKVRPMIFNADMVRALLEGRKTQTRRPITKKHLPFFELSAAEQIGQWDSRPMPIGVGDLIYVCETFRIMDEDDDCDCEYPCGHKTIGYPAYFATDRDRECKWTPSIHMPRWASRLTLKVTGVRVERVRDIGDQDAIKEGFKGGHGSIPDYAYSAAPYEHFADTWKRIYGESWRRNDWVWVIEFEVIRENVDAYLSKVSK